MQVVKQVPKVHLDYIERVVEAVDLPMLLDVVWLVGWLVNRPKWDRPSCMAGITTTTLKNFLGIVGC